MKKLNKRGFLLGEETIKIIISVICIVGLVYLLVSLYIANKNKDLELAKASLEKLVTDINAGRMETEIYNPKTWVISSWSSDCEGISLPEECLNKGWNNCLCLCAYPMHGSPTTSCNSGKGICLESDFSVDSKGTLSLGLECGNNWMSIKNPPLFLLINQQAKIITIKEQGEED